MPPSVIDKLSYRQFVYSLVGTVGGVLILRGTLVAFIFTPSIGGQVDTKVVGFVSYKGGPRIRLTGWLGSHCEQCVLLQDRA